MPYVVQPGTGVRHRFIFELRYDRGELYWDRSGRVARFGGWQRMGVAFD